ncbi:glycosyltransferase family 4 protein [Sulfolobus tengchongensis]|uniref:Glycosyltransferase family 4 protein n=1 Tax=Sulfolobus tengchongensis TaxID=207809 RepID=A0AAX4L232_9CREN
MRIVQVSPFYYPVIGGVERVVKKISEFLASKGYEVIVVTYNRDRNNKTRYKSIEEINGVKVIRVNPLIVWSHGSYSPSIAEVVKVLKPDIVHVHVWRHPYVFQLKNINSIRILQPHSPFYTLQQVGFVTYAYYKLIDNLLGSAIRKYNIISMTPLEQQLLMKKFNVNSTLIPNGVDDELFSITPRSYDFYLYIGRLSREKNIFTLLKAYKRSNIKRSLILAGPDNGIASAIRDYIRKENLNVKYIGEISEKEKIELLSACRAIINPSPYEGFGLTLVEAEAIGKPAIIVGHGGQEFAAPPGLASIMAENSVQSLADALLQMEDDKIVKVLSQGAKMWAENFKFSVIIKKYLEYYLNLFEGKINRVL